MNPDFSHLQPYPFEKLRALLQGIEPPADKPVIALSVGEPKHPAPQFVLDTLTDALRSLETYPATRGSDALRQAIADWLIARYALSGDAAALAERHVLPVNGTREALFAIAQCVLDRSDSRRPSVLMPNPFYQIYEGAALLAGCRPAFYSIDGEADDCIHAIDESLWQESQLLYLCNPGNPTGAVLSLDALQALIEKAQRHDVILVSDECYSEVYREDAGPPPGLLQAAATMGLTDYRHCLVFHSLSKRSNLPGLRSGFVAGDASLLEQFLLYRTYHGCSMPPPIQAASVAAWRDEEHVKANRALYDHKYKLVTDRLATTLPMSIPAAGFYLWPQIDSVSDTELTQRLLREQAIRVLPGSYLARSIDGHNPGANHLRMALVAPVDDCVDASDRIIELLSGL